MIHVPLRLVRSRSPAATCAWLLPGGDAAEWLREISLLATGLAELRVYVVPTSREDPRAAALLVVPQEAPAGPPAGGRALPLGRRGARLFLPVDGRLSPPMGDGELDALLGGEVHLFHPVHGLIAFDAADALQVSDLLEPMARRDARWDAADPGVRPPSLRGVHATEVPSAEAVLASGKGNASSRPFDSLPPRPGEKPRRPSRGPRKWIATRLLRMTRDVPRNSPSPTWIDSVERWARRQIHADLGEEREREIERLLHLLRTDPDLGLEFALPMAGIAARGIAEPSAYLTRRRTDFDLRQLRGGAPEDAWTLSTERTRDITALYRQQAERAIRLGQHRRAAYVLAHLLGDFRGAATALERGGRWREAASIYRERLGDRAAAATCLERGGLLSEAIALHLELGDRLRAAWLLDRVGRRAEAERLWREVVQERRAAGDRVGAAAILGAELRAPDEALAVLDEAWPQGGQADLRLRSALELLGKLGRGDEACRWVRRVRTAPGLQPVPIIHVLASAAVSHPDAGCRALAADTVRVFVGSELARPGSRNSPLLTSLVALDRGDRLLRRDAVRFGAAKGNRGGAVMRTAASYEVLGDFELPRLLPESVALVPSEAGLLVCGVSPGGAGVELHVLDWDGRARATRLRWELVAPRDRPPTLRVDPLTRRIVVAFRGGGPRLFSQPLTESDGSAWSVLTPAWIPDGLRGMCAGAALSTWTITDLAEERGYLATCHGQAGVNLRTVPIPTKFFDLTLPVVHVGRTLLIAAHRLLRVDAAGSVGEIGDEFAFRELVAAPRHLREAVVATGDSACRLWTRIGQEAPESRPFAEESELPWASFLGDGRIVVLDTNRVRVFRDGGARLRCVVDREGLRDRTWATVARGAHDREVVAVTKRADGDEHARVVRLRFPGTA